MEIAKVKVSGARCTPVYVGTITSGMVGATVSIEYTDPVWDNLIKTVVFRGACAKDVLDAGTEVTVPPEVLSMPMPSLYVGVYGVDTDGNFVIPTLWAELGRIRAATDPSGDTSADPTPPIWAQLLAMIGSLDNLTTEAKDNLVAAVNEIAEKFDPGGNVDDATIQAAVEKYLAENPPTAAAVTINGQEPDESGNFVINTLDDVEIAQLAAALT